MGRTRANPLAKLNFRGTTTETIRRIRASIREAEQLLHPDSTYWMRTAENRLGDVLEAVGREGYRTWFELTWPGDLVEECTWREIFEIADECAKGIDA